MGPFVASPEANSPAAIPPSTTASKFPGSKPTARHRRAPHCSHRPPSQSLIESLITVMTRKSASWVNRPVHAAF